MKIENYNIGGVLCLEKYCDKIPSEFVELEIGQLHILLEFCSEHMNQFEIEWEKVFGDKQERPKSKILMEVEKERLIESFQKLLNKI